MESFHCAFPGRYSRVSKCLGLSIRLTLSLATILLVPCGEIRAQATVEQLAKPPADAAVYTVLSTSGTNGKSYAWVTSDGTRMSRESILLRGQVWELDQQVVLGPDRMPSSWVVRGFTPN